MMAELPAAWLEGDRILVDPDPRQADLKTVLEQMRLSEFAEACAASGKASPLDGVTLLPVIPNPGKILCVGHNYEEHRQETGRAKTAHPSLFVRFADTLIGHEAPIVRPPFSSRSTSRESWRSSSGAAASASNPSRPWTLWPAIPASTTGVSATGNGIRSSSRRERTSRRRGRSGRHSSRLDEVGTLDDLRIETRLNGDVVQSSTLGHMIFPVADIIAYVSSFTRLSPGDVIATGTPGGVGAKRQPPVWLKPGDVVEVDIAGVGVLRNGVVDEVA